MTRAKELADVRDNTQRQKLKRGRKPYPRGPPEHAKLLRIDQARAVLGHMGKNKIYELIGRGDLEVLHIDSATYIVAASIDQFIERNRGAPLRPMPTTPKKRS
jgi:hypothetical protein